MPGLLRGVARTAVVAGTASTVAGRVNRRQQQKYAREDAEAQAQAEPAGQDYQDEMVTQLQQLSKLKDQGIITQDEFEAKKKQLLGI
jgi:hypothetical protein